MISAVLDSLLSSLFPVECQKCARPLASGQKGLCQNCFLGVREQALALQDTWHPLRIPFVQTAWSALRYGGLVREMLHRIKFGHEFYLMEPLCREAAPLFEAVTAETAYDAIIPMPTEWLRRWNRRFNQTEVMLGYLCGQNTRAPATRVIYKKTTSRPQHQLRSEERSWNLFGAFGILSPDQVRGKSLLLVDDIITTGATATEAARMLRRHGAKQVDFFSLARSEKNASFN